MSSHMSSLGRCSYSKEPDWKVHDDTPCLRDELRGTSVMRYQRPAMHATAPWTVLQW
jgi:hypothetical protein